MKAVLAYSGGLDTSVCIKLLQEKYNCDVITVSVDVGVPKKELGEAKKKAEMLGVLKHFTIDAKDEFARDYIFSAIKANASYEGYPLSTALARPLIAAKVVEVAKKENAHALAHGCTGKGNDQFRFDGVFESQAPEMKIIAPIRELNMTRKESIAYAKKNKIPVSADKKNPYSIDENLWGRSIEGGLLEDPALAPPEEIFVLTKVKTRKPEVIEISFDKGVPTAVNGKKMQPVELIEKMNTIAGKHGIGRIDIVEDRILGIKVRENYECPAAVAIITAHKALEQLVLTRAEIKLKEASEPMWGELVYRGEWTSDLKRRIDSLIAETQRKVSGKVKLLLETKHCSVIGRESKNSLYSKKIASFDEKA